MNENLDGGIKESLATGKAKVKESLSTGKVKAKELLEKGQEKYRTAMDNPNIRATLIGMIAFLVIIAIVVILISVSRRKNVDEFVKTKWATALEDGDSSIYKKLWDEKARENNKTHYQKAVKLLGKKLKVDEEGINYVRDLRNDNLYYFEEIPVTVVENGIERLTSRNLQVEKKGLLGKWKLIDDNVEDLEEEEVPPLATSKSGSTNESESASVAKSRKDNYDNQSGYTENRTEAPPSDSMDPISGDAPLDTKLKISQVIGEWQVAWQDQDVNEYMSKYADDAIITRVTVKSGKEFPYTLTKKELRSHMEGLIKRYKTIEVDISNLQIDGDRAIADVKFRQKFVGKPKKGLPIYSDVGRKTLTFMIDPSDGYWKIYEETWKMYVKVPRYPKF